MVERSPHSHSEWWPHLSDPLRRFGSKVAEFFTPASDAAATDDAYVVEVELPGVKEEDINIELHGNVVSVKGEKRSSHEEKGKTYYFSERSYGAFQRAFQGVQLGVAEAFLTELSVIDTGGGPERAMTDRIVRDLEDPVRGVAEGF